MALRGLLLNTSIFFCSFFLIAACKDNHCIDAPDVSGVELTFNVERIDKKLNKISKEDLESLISENPGFAQEFLKLYQYPMPEILIDRYYNLLNSSDIDSLFLEVEHAVGDMKDVEQQFQDAFRYLKYYYPELQPPKIQTAVTGIATDMYMSDSLIIVGLDYYLGPGAKYVPDNIPAYILKRYQKEYLVPQIILMYSNYFNKTNYEDKTALADMIYYGKAYYMAKNLMPCMPDSLLTGYTSFETQDIAEHEQVIWAGILENKLLYETNSFLKDKFLSERPKTYEIGENCPGRIGRWVGWQIVKKFAEKNPDLSVRDIMEIDDAQRIFSESGYKPIPY